jgi:hypothetical protein
MNTDSTSAMREDPQEPEGAAEDAERFRRLQRIRTTPKKSEPTFRTLVWDAGLGVACGILLILVFSLMFKTLLWGTASLTGH